MFDIDSGKLLIVAVLALIVIGPKELPRVLRQLGQAVGKMRRMANEFQGQFMDAMKEADIADIRKELDEINAKSALDFNFDPVRDVQAELTGVMNPTAPVVAAEATLPSPTEGFTLPAVDAGAETETTLAAEGIAPVAEGELPHVEGNEAAPITMPEPGAAKRKIFVKRRTSSFNVVRDERAAWTSGEPLAVRQRKVRPKTLVSENAPSL